MLGSREMLLLPWPAREGSENGREVVVSVPEVLQERRCRLRTEQV